VCTVHAIAKSGSFQMDATRSLVQGAARPGEWEERRLREGGRQRVQLVTR